MLRKEDQQLSRRLGARVREHRLRLPATQEEVAEMVGLSTQVYSRMERGGVLPSVPTLMRLCSALKAKPNDLLLDVSAGLVTHNTKASKISPDLARLTRILASADPRTVRTLLQLARGLSSTRSRKGGR